MLSEERRKPGTEKIRVIQSPDLVRAATAAGCAPAARAAADERSPRADRVPRLLCLLRDRAAQAVAQPGQGQLELPAER